MKYLMLDSGVGVLTERQPVYVAAGEEFEIKFDSLPLGALICVKGDKGDKFFYHHGTDTVLIPTPCKSRIYKVTADDGKRKWICEELRAEQINGDTFFAPNDANLPSVVAMLRVEVQSVTAEVEKLRGEIAETNKRMTELLEGYDI